MLTQLDFNSTMVRLKVYEETKDMQKAIFQFHYGSVKRKIVSTITKLTLHISIPLWFG